MNLNKWWLIVGLVDLCYTLDNGIDWVVMRFITPNAMNLSGLSKPVSELPTGNVSLANA